MIFYGRDPGRVLLIQVVYGAVAVQALLALLALLGEHGTGATGGFLGAALGSEWRSRRQFGPWKQRRAIADDVLSGRDPGPEHRPTVDRVARTLVAQRYVGPVLAVVFPGGLGVACLVIAAVRDDWWLTWPATTLLLCMALLIGTERQATRPARAWLAGPPPVTVGSGPQAGTRLSGCGGAAP